MVVHGRSFFLLDATAGYAGAPQHGKANAYARNQQRVMHDHRKVTSIASLARSMSPAPESRRYASAIKVTS